MNVHSTLLLLGIFMSWNAAFSQSDLQSKAAMIDGVRAFRSNSANADSLLALGTSHSTLGAVAEYNLGRSLIQSGDTARAEAAFRSAIGETDDAALRSSAWHNLGNIQLQKGQLNPAISSFKQALRQDPTNDPARYNLAYAMRLAQQENEQEQDQNGEQEQDQDQNGEQDQEQDQNGEQEQDQDQNGEQEQDQNGEQDQDQEQNGEQDQEQEQNGEEDEEQEQNGEQDQEQEQEQSGEQETPQTIEGQISPEDMERILESLERNEAAIQAKLQRQRNGGKPRQIEKDW